MNLNTFDRIAHYFHAAATEPFTYMGREYKVISKLIVTPSVFKSYRCPENCGACCKPVSLVWNKNEFSDLLDSLHDSERQKVEGNTSIENLEINGRKLEFYVFKNISSDFCYFLNKETGRCSIYKNRILPGKLELFKFAISEKKDRVYARVTKPGRGWAYKTVSGSKGVLCQMGDSYSKELVDSYINALEDIDHYMIFFGIRNDVKKIIRYLNSYQETVTMMPLVINRRIE